jgi:hypothetical protein
LSCSSLPQALWSLVGMGARLVQDLGLHRKVVYSGKPNVQEEQWKRAFWYDHLIYSPLCSLKSSPGSLHLLIASSRWVWDVRPHFKAKSALPSFRSFYLTEARLASTLICHSKSMTSIGNILIQAKHSSSLRVSHRRLPAL